MNPKENVVHQKARLDDAVYNALIHLRDPGSMEYFSTICKSILTIAGEYEWALREAIPHVPDEIAEHYQHLAEQASSQADFFVKALLSYRRQQHIL